MSNVSYLKTYQQRSGANVGPSRTCKWISGVKPYGPRPYCDAPTVEGYSWCEHHKEIVFKPMVADSTEGFMKHTAYIARITR